MNHEREPRWPAVLSVLAAVAMHFALPPSLRTGPPWLGATLVAALVAFAYWTAMTDRRRLNAVLAYAVSMALTIGLINGVARLVISVLHKSDPPIVLLRSAVILWGANVIVFALWYWRLDAGGPFERMDRGGRHTGAFLFPQMTQPTMENETWRPLFIDYLFLSFNTSTAFSPTDSPVLSRWAKMLTMTESILSLTTLLVLIARAINTL